jgi:hypothetical protein
LLNKKGFFLQKKGKSKKKKVFLKKGKNDFFSKKIKTGFYKKKFLCRISKQEKGSHELFWMNILFSIFWKKKTTKKEKRIFV